jgi:hypothetical protein
VKPIVINFDDFVSYVLSNCAGDMLDVLEHRWDWASFGFTVDLFKYVFLNFIPDVIFHTQAQDEEQVRDNYDRTRCYVHMRDTLLT